MKRLLDTMEKLSMTCLIYIINITMELTLSSQGLFKSFKKIHKSQLCAFLKEVISNNNNNNPLKTSQDFSFLFFNSYKNSIN